MPPRPYVLLSCATSADGYLDDASPTRLILSGPADLDRVDEVRAGCDAILVGAGTIRADDPRLLIRDPRRRARRAARGLPEHPARVTLTATGDLDPAARFFTPGAERLVYCATSALPEAKARVGDRAVLIDAGDPLSLRALLNNLAERSVARLLVEGGAQLLAEFLTEDLANELHHAIAPFFVAQPAAPRLDLASPPPAAPRPDPASPRPAAPHLDLASPRPASSRSASPCPAAPTTHANPFNSIGPTNPNSPARPMTLVETRRLDDVVLHRYLIGPGGTDQRFLAWAVELARLCPPSESAFSVGAVIVADDGQVLATGFSREQEEHDHAEEVALRKLGFHDPRLRRATVYSSLVPCGARASRPVTCVQHIVATGIPRVVFAWDEPPLFTAGDGARQLRAAGVQVAELAGLADRARLVNAHLVGSGA